MTWADLHPEDFQLVAHRLGAAEEIDQAQIDLELDTILKGTIYTTRHVAPVMMKAKQGAIINITSTSALRGINSNGVYFAAKHGQRGFGDSMFLFAPHSA